MAKKKKEFEYESILDSIFKTLTSKEKANGKLKPVKFDHKPSGTDEMARAITEIAGGLPGYAAKGLYGGTTGPLENMGLIAVNVDEADAYGHAKTELKIKVKDLPTLINDPDKLVDAVMNQMKQNSQKDSLAMFGRALDTGVVLLHARGARIDDPVDFAMAAGTWVSPNMDRNTDKHVVGTAVFSAGGALAGVDTATREVMAKNAWKAMDNGKMRSQYGASWYALADPNSLAYKSLAKSPEFDGNPAKLAALSAEIRKNFDSSLNSAGVGSAYHDDILKGLTNETNHFNPNDSHNRRFYSYQGNPDKPDIASPSAIAYTPGYYREAYARKNEAKLKSLNDELQAEMSKAVPDNTKISSILGEINSSARNAGVAKYTQNLLGYNNHQQYGAQNPKYADGVPPSDKLGHEVIKLKKDFLLLKSSGLNVDDQINKLEEMEKSFGRIASLGAAPMGTGFKDFGNVARTLGSSIGLSNQAEEMNKLAHETANLAIEYQIRNLDNLKSQVSTMYPTKSAQDAMIASMDEQIKALREEQNHYSPSKFKINQWTRSLARYNQSVQFLSSVKNGTFVANLFNGDFFDPGKSAFATGKMADPDAGEAFSVQSLKGKIKDGKVVIGKNGDIEYDADVYRFFLKEDTDRAQWYRELTRYNYLLPQNIVKTIFWDGSGFKYEINHRYNRFMDGDQVFRGGKNIGFLGMISAFSTEFMADGKTPNPNFNKAFQTSLFQMIMKTHGISDPSLITPTVIAEYARNNPGRIFAEIKNLPSDLAGLQILYENGILNSFTMKVARFANEYSPDAILNAFKKNVIKKIFQNQIVNGTLQKMLTFGGRFGAGTAWGTAVGEFIATKIGFQQLLMKGATLLAEALGIGTGGIATVVIMAIQFFLPGLLDKIIKPVLKIVLGLVSVIIKGAAIGIILLALAVIFLLGGGTVFTYAPTALISPLESAGESTQPETVANYCSPDPSNELPISNIKGKCPWKGPTICTQLPNKDPSCSHGALYNTLGIMAVDTVDQGYFYAPGECVVISDGPAVTASCGNKMIVDCTMEGGKVEFTLMHVDRAYTSTKISQGHPIAKMQVCGTNGYVCADGGCSTGAHFHISASVPNKGQLNTDLLFQKLCGGPGYCDKYILCGADSPV